MVIKFAQGIYSDKRDSNLGTL